MEKPLNDFKESFTYNYAYKVHTFLPYKINQYIIQCEGQEQIIKVEQHK